ncbi:acetyl-CoA carboxylase biotin carboxylase subunit [candidate division WOR-3 bacterium JGI_Cruoil_03_44_89]|uniref:Biotin carboxylase n=1 Tax=candidate division WOR-3 bacterium JGI_Cruoil_03_44_89 TaxID=1973748 RepID=A0A235BV20_UNCW3|nr:MAG: acetyl-CoA carboxylase biotin carboxylase subunit [candidate division WOR-3 bacterium JGI_Cruoil_03_44_89]
MGFKKILIANRGEIALRIIRACRELGIETVAIYSDVDESSMHVVMADEAVCIGPASPKDSYLSIPRIISACEISGVDAVHPGYGFLAENPRFAEICEENGFKFIGPKPEVIREMGNKSEAKEFARKAGVPVIPGSNKAVTDIGSAERIAEEIGYPVIIKAAFGGGGRGMKIVHSTRDIEKFINIASSEAETAFGSGDIYIEKYIENPRHIEVQILGDEHGNIVWLGERECSIQRRHQKLIEEAPSPIVDEDLRKKLGDAAKRFANYVGYASAGTVEFLLNGDKNYYFMEVNSRIQVEHPVTEEVTGVDIVKEQIRIAEGERLSLKQEDVRIEGSAIECRINAEDPDKNFMSTPGKITALYLPGGHGVRIDTNIYTDYVIPPHYDSLVAKIIAKGKTRKEAITKMTRVLEEFMIEGIKTTIPLHLAIMRNEKFIKGEIDTGFVERM